jgi:outer membrane protein OmpA-like peptidoglycan-associated protein
VAWSPGLAQARAWTACLTAETAVAPVVAQVSDGEGTRLSAPLDGLWGLDLGGSYGLGRVGIGADVPVWLASQSDSTPQGAAMGDVRVYAPIALVRPSGPGALGVDAVAELLLPTGDPDKLLGAGGPGAAAHVVVGQAGPRVAGSVDLGVGYTGGASLSGLDTRLWTRLALAGDWRPWQRLGVGAELWFQATPLSDSTFAAASPGEALLRVNGAVNEHLWVGLAGGTAITPGVGAAAACAYLRVGYVERPTRPVAVPVDLKTDVAPAPPGPFDVLVSVRDEEGHPLTALVRWTGEGAPAESRAGPDVETRATLRPGRFTLAVSAEGFGEQRRGIDLSADRFRPERVTVLLQRVAGDGTLRLGVSDSEGRDVAGANVSLDGRQLGATATGGTLEVDGVAPGTRSLVVAHPDFRGQGAREVLVPQSPGEVARIVLERPPGSVRVVTRGVSGPVPDARVRFAGPEDLPAQNVGPDGERTFTLPRGHWVMVASAADLGTQEREFEVEAGRTSLVVIDVRMREAEAGAGRLVVRVVDPAGAPVDDAEVHLDGESVGHTANGGALTLEGLQAGPRRIGARGARFRDAEAREVVLGEGTREVTLGLRWRAGQVHLVARGVEGAMVDARVRFSGPEEVPPSNLGPDGEAWFELVPGRWTRAIASPTYGIQERDVDVRPDDVALVEIGARLLSADGGATLALTVKGADGAPLAGALVEIDGREVGTTASAGTMELASLREGRHPLRVSAPGYQAKEWIVELREAQTEVSTTLVWSGRRLDVLAAGPTGPARDAVVRAYGAQPVAPAPVDAEGRRALVVDPGDWTLVAVSESLGMARQDVQVAPAEAALPVALRLAATPPATASLLVEIVDPAGGPVAGATLSADGVARPGGPDGIVLVEGLTGASVALGASAPGYRAREPEAVSLVAGSGTRRLRLDWLPRPVLVRVTDGKGRPVDAEVRAYGPGRAEPRASGSAGASFDLMPGDWQIVASTAGFGPWRQDVRVGAGVEPAVVDAVLGGGKVELTGTSVVIRERVNFAFDKADIEPDSYPVLEQVASTLLLHPEITRLEVRGHTDDRGTEVYNLDLSQRRADAVRAFLLRREIEPSRVEAKGFGTTRPVATNTSEAGRAKNRRVEFEILATGPTQP